MLVVVWYDMSFGPGSCASFLWRWKWFAAKMLQGGLGEFVAIDILCGFFSKRSTEWTYENK